MSPKRIQRQRTKGWRMPEGAVYVGRPTKWGNPAFVDRYVRPDHTVFAAWTPEPDLLGQSHSRHRALQMVVDWYSLQVGPMGVLEDVGDAAKELAGKDLACWCPLDQPCHADVLLEIANGGAS